MATRVYSPSGEPFDISRRELADKLILELGWTQTPPEPEIKVTKSRKSKNKSKNKSETQRYDTLDWSSAETI